MAIPEVSISDDMKLAKAYLKRTSLFWSASILTLPTDFFSLFLVLPDHGYDINRIYLLLIVLIAAIISANHTFVLNLILFSKKVNYFINKNSKKIALGLLVVFFIYISLAISLWGAEEELTFLSILFYNLGYFISILSIVFLLSKKKKKIDIDNITEDSTVIPIERIYYICIGRILIPRLLSFWAAVLCSLQAISHSTFLCFSLLGLTILINAKPGLSNFITKCRACGKEVLYGAGEHGLCKDCIPMLAYKGKKFTLPPKFNPYHTERTSFKTLLNTVHEKSMRTLENINQVKDKIISKINLPSNNRNNDISYEEYEECQK